MSNTICFESKTLLMYLNATNQLGRDENLPIEIRYLSFILSVTLNVCKLRELCETILIICNCFDNHVLQADLCIDIGISAFLNFKTIET